MSLEQDDEVASQTAGSDGLSCCGRSAATQKRRLSIALVCAAPSRPVLVFTSELTTNEIKQLCTQLRPAGSHFLWDYKMFEISYLERVMFHPRSFAWRIYQKTGSGSSRGVLATVAAAAVADHAWFPTSSTARDDHANQAESCPQHFNTYKKQEVSYKARGLRIAVI